MQLGYKESEELIFCNFVWETLMSVPFKVRECSSFQEKDIPTKREMEEIALMINPSSSGKTAGFHRVTTTKETVASTE